MTNLAALEMTNQSYFPILKVTLICHSSLVILILHSSLFILHSSLFTLQLLKQPN